MSIEVTIKLLNTEKFAVLVSLDESVLDLKTKIAEQQKIPVQNQKLISKGKVMKDDLLLETYGITPGHIIHLVKSGVVNSSPAPEAAPAATPLPSSTPNPPNPFSFASPTNPSPLFGSGSNGSNSSPFGAGLLGSNMQSMQQQLMQNPELMQQLMNSPMVTNLLNNPEQFQNMLLNNPQMQEVLNQNPHVRQALSDPALMRQTMEMMRNPNSMREMMRGQDLAMSRIENMPGGFNMLRQLYEDVQEPMMEATQNTFASAAGFGASGTNNSFTSNSTQNSTQAPPSSAIPNPWASPSAANFPPNNNSMPWGMGAMGGMGSGNMPTSAPGSTGFNGMPNMNPQMLNMMQSPMYQQMMQQMLNDPNYIQQMSAMNPQFGAMMQNPQARAMLSNPDFLRQMSNPANIQAIMQMNSAMQTLQNNGMMGSFLPPMGGAPPTSGGNSLDFSSLLGAGNSMGSQSTPSVPMFNNSSPVAPPRLDDFAQIYSLQLTQLSDMGFTDTQANISALQATGGNVNAAVERLLQNFR